MARFIMSIKCFFIVVIVFLVTSINYGDGNGNRYMILNDRGRWINKQD